MLKTSDFDFNLPEELIAKKPVSPRDEAKMLVCSKGKLADRKIKDLADFLDEGDLVVFNDTKVVKAKLVGRRGQKKISINLNCDLGNNVWQAFARPEKKLKIGDIFMVADDFNAQIVGKNAGGIVELKFNVQGEDFFLKLDKYGQMPIPPYIKRPGGASIKEDEINYQTIYAKNQGAVAAPTAGLHFTDEIFKKLENKGIEKVFATLNVGAGTFQTVKSEYIKDHQIHSEFFSITKEVCDKINRAKRLGKRIVAVGTTSLRILETIADDDGIVHQKSENTKIFIYPPYKFKVVDVLVTNFHLPRSTLFMLISAFTGSVSAKELYEHAIVKKYRFYSYGDSCLLIK